MWYGTFVREWLRFTGGHCLSAFRHLLTWILTVVDTMPCHTGCGLENSATYVQSGRAPSLPWQNTNREESSSLCRVDPASWFVTDSVGRGRKEWRVPWRR